MSDFPELDQLNQIHEPKTAKLSSNMTIDEWIKTLQSSDRLLYNMMALEVWSIAKTMDRLFPGFWNRFMTNRQLAVQEFIKQKQAARTEGSHAPNPPESVNQGKQ